MKTMRPGTRWLLLFLVPSLACSVLPSGGEPGAQPAGEVDVEGTIQAGINATLEAQSSATQAALEALPEPTATQASGTSANPKWGEAFCPATVPICIRPYALQALGNQQLLRLETWGTGDPTFSTDAYLSWQAQTPSGQTGYGYPCANSYSLFPSYQQGFGHMTDICFNLAERPNQLTFNFSGWGLYLNVPFPVGEDLQPLGDWDHFAMGKPVELDASLIVGPATVSIRGLDAQADFVVIQLTIEAKGARVLVESPQWIITGPRLQLMTVDRQGRRAGWDEGKMRGYLPLVGGEVAAGEKQEGSAVLRRVAADWALLIGFGDYGDHDDAVIVLP
jgi:hypothetical protein